jgi:hypothetical protein
MKLLKLTNPKAQNQSRYLKKRKKIYFFFKNEFRNETFETYRSKGAKSKLIPKKKEKKNIF